MKFISNKLRLYYLTDSSLVKRGRRQEHYSGWRVSSLLLRYGGTGSERRDLKKTRLTPIHWMTVLLLLQTIHRRPFVKRGNFFLSPCTYSNRKGKTKVDKSPQKSTSLRTSTTPVALCHLSL